MKYQTKIIALLEQEFNNYIEVLKKNNFQVENIDLSTSPLPENPAIYLISTSLTGMEEGREFISLVKALNCNNRVVAIIPEEKISDDLWNELSSMCDDIVSFPVREKEFLHKIEFLSAKEQLQPSYSTQYHKAKRMAQTDELTGIGNRRYIMEILKKEMKRCRRINSDMSLILFDIDYFKLVNDLFGHHTGDTVLCQVAAFTSQLLRDTDYIARYGGDEFIILLPDTDLKGARQVAEKIRKQVETHSFGSFFNEIRLTISLGMSSLKLDMSEQSFIDQADKALYIAKYSGRNKTSTYIPTTSIYPNQTLPFFQPTILCIEDNPDIQELLTVYLENKNIKVLSAFDGYTGIKMSGKKDIDLILLDIYLPDISGFDICEKIKVASGHNYKPVIIISALNDQEGIMKGYKVGADDYIAKPLDLDVLYEKIKVFLRLKHQLNDKLRYYHFIEKLGPPILRSARQQSISTACQKISHRLNNFLMRAELLKDNLKKMEKPPFSSTPKHSSSQLPTQTSLMTTLCKDLGSFTFLLDNIARLNPFLQKKFLNLSKCLPPQMKKVKQELQEKYPGKKIHVHMKGFSSPAEIRGDSEALFTIINNILENSVQHGSDMVNIHISVQKKDSHIYCIFRDNGPGISPENTERVFEPFFQEDSHKHGLGLGLFFVRLYITKMDGTITLQSKKGKGTTIKICFPSFSDKRPEKIRKSISQNLSFTQFKVLLIEDESDIALHARKHLLQLPYVKKVDICQNGYLAMKKVSGKEDFNVYIVDLSIPGISGWHILEELKMRNAPRLTIVITGLKSSSREFLMQTLKVHSVLYKPFDLDELTNVLKQYYQE